MSWCQKFITLYFCLFTVAGNSYGQSMVVSPESIDTAISRIILSNETFFVNGLSTIGLTKNMAVKHYNSADILKISLSIIALRLFDRNQIKLNKSISFDLPDIIEKNPFTVAITPNHLLTETGGFAVPTVFKDTPLARYAIQARTAGQISHSDPVGWAILIRLLEKISGKNIQTLFTEELLQPLGLQASDLTLKQAQNPLLTFTQSTVSGKYIAEVSRLLIRNLATNGHRFITKKSYDLLVNKNSWRMHPLAPNHTLGAALFFKDNQRWLSPKTNSNNAGPYFMAFPKVGINFINLSGHTAAFEAAIISLAANKFLPVKPDGRLREARQLRQYRPFSGYYIRDDQPSMWLKKRLASIEDTALYFSQRGDTSVMQTIERPEGKSVKEYRKILPFYYKANDGETLLFSPFRSGGYVLKDGILHRHIGILGNSSLVISLFPTAILILLTGGLYIRYGISQMWKKMGQFSIIGTLLVCAGLACDYLWWPSAIFEWDMPYLVNLWRAVMNIGLMLVMSVPMFALSFTRRNHMPAGAAIAIVPAHLAILTVAALTLFLILISWGVAGEFSAY